MSAFGGKADIITPSIIAAITVAVGVGAWNRTLIGGRRIELAEDTLTLFYGARDAIRMIRSPFAHAGEGSTRQRRDNENEGEAQVLDMAYVAFERYEKKSELFAKLMALRYRFRAYFGPESVEPFETLKDIVNDILGASNILAHLWVQREKGLMERRAEERQERTDKAEVVFWEGLGDPDPINPRLEQAISDIDSTCRAVIAPEHSICTVIRDWWRGIKRFLTCRDA